SLGSGVAVSVGGGACPATGSVGILVGVSLGSGVAVSVGGSGVAVSVGGSGVGMFVGSNSACVAGDGAGVLLGSAVAAAVVSRDVDRTGRNRIANTATPARNAIAAISSLTFPRITYLHALP